MRSKRFLFWECIYTTKDIKALVRHSMALKKPPRREAIKIILLYPNILPIVPPCGDALRI